MKHPLKSLALASLLGIGAAGAQACGRTTDCVVELGTYNIALPEAGADTGANTGAATGADTGVLKAPKAELIPAVIFLHGFGGSGKGVMRNAGVAKTLLDRGYALIAPSGMIPDGRTGGSWSFHPDWKSRRDEVAFLTSVRDQVIAKHGIDPNHIVLAGFSIGGSMTSYLACQTPDSFSAYAPLGGSFWRPHPSECAGPVRLLHTHGWTDGTVPLEGRILREIPMSDQLIAQGDVFQAMQIWRKANLCVHMKADSFVTEGDFWRRKWERCAPGSALEFALFPKGHIIPKGWADMMLDWYEAL